MNKRNKTAFTVIELSIVVLIIAIVVGLTISRSYMVGIAQLTNLRSLSSSSPVYDIPDNTLWLDVARKDAFLVYPKDETVIDTWIDASPNLDNNLVFTQAVVGNRPVFRFDTLDHLPALYFDVNDRLISNVLSPGYTFASPNQITVFVVLKRNSPDLTTEFVRWPNAASDFFIRTIAASSRLAINFGDNTSGGGSALVDLPANFHDNWNIVMAKRLTTGVGEIRVNGVSLPMISAGMANAFNTSLTDYLEVGRNMDGALREVLIFKRALSNNEVVDIERYLSTKWQINID